MLGKRSADPGLMEADHPYLDHVGRNSFYGLLATQRDHLFQDEDFAALYCLNNGRPSVPPSLLATALLLQTYDRVSDEEAKARADYDLRWKVALGVGLEERPSAKSTLQCFRAQLILHGQVRTVFQQSLAFARQTGDVRHQKIKVVVDTSHIFGRGAVKDTYNLLADGIVKLARALAATADCRPETWAAEHDLMRYFGSSLKGEATIDWDDPGAREAFLRAVVAEADRLLEVTRHTFAGLLSDDPEQGWLRQAAEVLPGNAHDHEQALEVVAQAEANTKVTVEETIGDCAFGDSDTRQAFAMAGRTLVAQAPQRRGQAQFPKEDFQIDLEAMTCVCPAGDACRTVVSISSAARYGAPGTALRAFRFDAERCDACPLRPSCVRARPGRGRL